MALHKGKRSRAKFNDGGDTKKEPKVTVPKRGKSVKRKFKTLKELTAEKKALGEGRTGITLEEPLESNETPGQTRARIRRQKAKGKKRKTIKP